MKKYKQGFFLLGLLLSILIWSCQNGGTDPNPKSTKSYLKTILSFDIAKVPSLDFDTTAAVWDGKNLEETRSITLQVPFGADVTALVPTIIISDKASVSPGSGVAQDFTKPVNYTVTAEDGTNKVYLVTVKPNPTADFWIDAPAPNIYLAPDELPANLGPLLTLTGGNFRNVAFDKLVLTSKTSTQQFTFPVFSSTSMQLQFKLPVSLPVDAYSFSVYVGNQFVTPNSTLYIIKFPRVTSVTPSLKHLTNLTITGTNLGAVSNITFTGGTSVSKSAFVSQSETSIVVIVPATASAGKLVLTTSSGYKIDTNPITIILPIGTNLTPNPAVPGATDITITGTNLDLIASLKLPGVKDTIQASSFKSWSATKIVLGLPALAVGGDVGYKTILGYKGSLGVQVVLLPPPPALVSVIFDDVLHDPFFMGGGYGGVTTDAANTENPRVGSKAIKYAYTGTYYGTAQIENFSGDGRSMSTAGSTYFAFSIYGGPGTDGKNIRVIIEGTGVLVPIDEGKWKDVKIPLTSFGSPAGVAHLNFQENSGWSGFVYIDEVGFR